MPACLPACARWPCSHRRDRVQLVFQQVQPPHVAQKGDDEMNSLPDPNSEEKRPPVRLYHRTNAATAILADGFRDHESHNFPPGVWLSASPLDVNEGAKGEQLLEVSLYMTAAEMFYEYEVTPSRKLDPADMRESSRPVGPERIRDEEATHRGTDRSDAASGRRGLGEG